jgi:predicted ArsR family transcriptional regulator
VTEDQTLGTRDRIVGLLREKPLTVEELASRLGVTKNAIRSHLPALERDGVVEAVGRRPTSRKPAVLYRTTSAAEERLSRAYVPLLGAILTALEDRLDAADLVALLEDAGRRLVAEGGRRDGVGDGIRVGAELAGEVLRDLGGVATVEEDSGVLWIRGASCPLAGVVRDHPEVCRAVETLVSRVAGGLAREHCDRGERPACCFEVLDRPSPSAS